MRILVVEDEAAAAAVLAKGLREHAYAVDVAADGLTALEQASISDYMLANTEKDAALTDRRGRLVIGEVEREVPAPQRENRRPELEVDIIGLPARGTFTIVIDDRPAGTFTTDDRGSVDMELQEGEVPTRPSEI